MRVLIVDDEPVLREIIAYNIADEGYTVLQASGGREALELILSQEIHFVITDMKMPEGSGEELLRALAQRNPKTPILLMTGHCDLTKENALELGAIDLIEKPFDQNVIIGHAQQVYEALAS